MLKRELEVENLSVAFGGDDGEFTVVDDISYYLNSGETLAIVGESGCGKTVSALSILRLIPNPPGRITGGQIRFDTRDILSLSSEELRELRGNKIAMIFQEPMTSLNPVLTIGEQVTETLLRHTSLTRKEAWQRSIDLLRQVDIPAPELRMDTYPHQLSGGMRQRAMIAMALSCNPRILIADEPTTALDVLIQAQILELLKKLKEETGMSILLITHDLGVVAETAQRVLIMYAGKIVESGSVKQLFQLPLHPYTLGLMNSVPKAGDSGKRERLSEIEGNVPSPRELPAGCAFHPRCPSVMERCKTQKPQLQEKQSGHMVSCWLHE